MQAEPWRGAREIRDGVLAAIEMEEKEAGKKREGSGGVLQGKQKARTRDGVMWKMSIFAMSLCVQRGETGRARLSSGGGEELCAGAWGWRDAQRQSKIKGNYISF